MSRERKWSFKYQTAAPTQDPYLLIEFINENYTLLFDCGIRIWGQVKTLLKISHLFISHAHIDHFIGFDHIIRALLGESRRFVVYGPPGIADKISAKLSAYDWDRASDQELVVEVNELGADYRLIRTHACRDRFTVGSEKKITVNDSLAVKTPSFSVHFALMDHGGSPCMAYSFHEVDRLRIKKDSLDAMGLKPGPWIGRFLRELTEPDEGSRMVDTGSGLVKASELKERLVELYRGKKITYLTDTVFSDAVCSDLKRIADHSDLLVSESTFLHEDKNLAQKYHHLTARQAALIAREIHARRLLLLHISNRYFPRIDRIAKEAREIFPETDLAKSRYPQRKKNFRNGAGT